MEFAVLLACSLFFGGLAVIHADRQQRRPIPVARPIRGQQATESTDDRV